MSTQIPHLQGWTGFTVPRTIAPSPATSSPTPPPAPKPPFVHDAEKPLRQRRREPNEYQRVIENII